ncbi:MAG: InlB B-repeat-containing protein [Lachnospiraceae bacterium]|nr:InlB B-repeat-containing protein [Lachnospiraceae bacterium]
MKNRIKSFSAIVFLSTTVMLGGCGQSGTQYAVRFEDNYDMDAEYDNQTVSSGKKLTEPDTPSRDGYVFIGWYKDDGLTEKWDFSKDKVKEDITLYAGWDADTQDEITHPDNDKDFSSLRTPGSQEEAYEYNMFFLPEVDGTSQPYVGDTMPYYEDSVYYIYYLKEGGDSFNHSVYLATTSDFVNYSEQDDVVLEASIDGGQDGWIGTGSVVKVDGKYYFFYTGHTGSAAAEYKEKIMVAESNNLTSFNKVSGWAITPPDELGQKNDFRDPQAYYDPDTGTISLTVTASKDGVARILKYTLSADLNEVNYDGIIFSNSVGDFWNLECSDTFKIGDKWYITYSAQDDTLWYAASDSQFGPYSEAKRLEGKLFYAAKHVEDGENTYMVGWARRSESASSTQDVAGWAGNMEVQKVVQKEDGELILAPVDNIAAQFQNRRELMIDDTHVLVESGSAYSYVDVFTCYESFMLTGDFIYSGEGEFGLCFDYSGRADKYKMISICPGENKLQHTFNEGDTLISEMDIELVPGKVYSFTYIQEGSVGIFYIDDEAALTVRLYGVSGKPIKLFAGNNSVVFSSLRQYTR